MTTSPPVPPGEGEVEEPEIQRIPPREEGDPRRLAPARWRLAFALAVAADAIQWIFFPIFMWGGASPVNDVLDFAMAAIMIRLLGFHWAFLPAFVMELAPFADFVPTWTAAVWLATRGRRGS